MLSKGSYRRRPVRAFCLICSRLCVRPQSPCAGFIRHSCRIVSSGVSRDAESRGEAHRSAKRRLRWSDGPFRTADRYANLKGIRTDETDHLFPLCHRHRAGGEPRARAHRLDAGCRGSGRFDCRYDACAAEPVFRCDRASALAQAPLAPSPLRLDALVLARPLGPTALPPGLSLLAVSDFVICNRSPVAHRAGGGV